MPDIWGENHMAGYQQVPRMTLSLGLCVRSDGEKFGINALIYELPKGQDSWLVVCDPQNRKWGHNRFALLIPRYFADTLPLVETIAKTDALRAFNDSLELSRTETALTLATVSRLMDGFLI